MTSLLRFRLVRHLLAVFTNLPKRIALTWRYHGPRETIRRALLFPLRLTPLAARLGLGPRLSDPAVGAVAWYRRRGRPVAVVIPPTGRPASSPPR